MWKGWAKEKQVRLYCPMGKSFLFGMLNGKVLSEKQGFDYWVAVSFKEVAQA